MKSAQIYPVIYGVVTSLIVFIATIAIMLRSFKMSFPIVIVIASVLSLLFYSLSYFRLRASLEIKRIVREHQLTPEQLAQITGLSATNFPIYNSKLSLIVPKRQWPQVLDALQKYEAAQQEKKS